MNLFELFVKIGVDDQASNKLSDLSSKLGSGLKTAAKIGTAAVGAAATGIAALTTAAVNNYAEYEQLVGGVETLFKTSSDKVMEYAENAYKTAGLSANEYMNTVTSFSASLLQSLGNDTNAAAEYADMAITDMSDNANKMGTSMEMIQNAYQGFAKQNYTMLDNLKLGYGGTKEEMQRLIADAAELSDTVDAQSMSFDNIVEAIHVVQTEMGITGTTAKEAGTTIQGSVASMKSAWTNLLTGLADGNADIEQLVDDLVTTVVGDGTESNLGVLGNILPAVETALNGASALVRKALPKIVEIIPTIINDNLPVLAEAAVGIIQSLIDGISQNQEMLFETIFGVVTYLAESFITMLPQIVELGLNLIVSLANGIAESLPELIPTIVDVVLQIVDTLTSPDTITSLIDAALAIMLGLAEGLIKAIPDIVAAIPTIIENLIQALIDAIPQIIEAGVQLFVALVENLPAIIAGIVEAIPEIIMAILDGLASLGGQLADLFSKAWEGIKNVFSGVGDWFKEKFTEGKEKANEAWSNAKELFSKNWENVKAGYSAVGQWFKDTFTDAKNKAASAWDNAKSVFSGIWKKVKSGFNIGDALKWGKDMIDNFVNGIKSKISAVTSAVSGVARKVKGFLGFSEPEEGPLSNFHTYAPDMMKLFAQGIKDNEKVVTSQIEKSFDFGERTIKFGAEYGDGFGIASSTGATFGGTSIGNVTINIDGARYSNENSLAEAIAEALQNMTDRRTAVYA